MENDSMSFSAMCAFLLLFLLFIRNSYTTGIYFACYYGADKGRSYIGLKAVTATGKRCALSGNGSNFCRNFDGSEESPWCGTGKDAQKEICNVDECDGISLPLTSANITSSLVSTYREEHLLPGLAIDKNLSYSYDSCFLSVLVAQPAWWKADLRKEIVVTAVGLQLLVSDTLAEDYQPAAILVKVSLSEVSFHACGNASTDFDSPVSVVYRRCGSSGIRGRYVLIESLVNRYNKSQLCLCEVQVNRAVELEPQCREYDFLLKENKTFTVLRKGDVLEVKCKDGYWPTDVQRFQCNSTGGWFNFNCKKVGILTWRTIGATAKMKPIFFYHTTGAGNAIDGVVPKDTGAGKGFHKCLSTTHSYSTRRLTITFPTDYLVISVQLYLRDNGPYDRQSWQNGVQVLAVERNGTENQCGKDYNSKVHGQTPIFSCNPGIISGSLLLRLRKGEWPLQVCEVSVTAVIDCGKPPFVEHAQLSSEKNELNSNVTYVCTDGYAPSSNPVVRCLTNGSWSQPIRSCEPGCKSPPSWPRASFTKSYQTRIAYFSKVEYICDPGYEPEGKPVLVCNSSGQWEGNINCTAIRCRNPISPVNGYYRGSSFHYNDTIAYRCYFGYVIRGNSSSRCVENKTWSSSPPHCEVVSCPKPPKPDNGSVQFSGTRANSTANYSCDHGYVLEGKRLSKCRPDSRGGEATWERATCKPPVFPEHGRFIGTKFEYTNKIVFFCDTGFRLKGNTVFACDADGNWTAGKAENADLPTCERVNCSFPVLPKNGKILEHQSFLYLNNVTYGCNEGFCMEGNEIAVCTESGVWSNNGPQCIRIQCPVLESPANSSVVQPNISYVGMNVSISCDKGFQLLGNGTVNCILKTTGDCIGRWSSLPSCQPVMCRLFDTANFSNGSVSGDKYFFMEKLQFSCQRGFKLQGGGPIWQCNHDGRWIDTSNGLPGAFPICQPKACSPPETPMHGRVVGDNFLFLAKVKFICQFGYCMRGSIESQCTHNGSWSSPSPDCIAVICPELKLPSNGYLSWNRSNRTVGTSATYHCNEGYDLHLSGTINGSIRVCTQNDTVTDCIGHWTGSIPQCIAKQCVNPPQPKNGTVDGTEFFYPQNINFRCNPGFELRGNAVFRCDERGKWVGVASPNNQSSFPTCELKFCSSPPFVNNSQISGTDYYFPSKVQYSCSNVFCLKGVNAVSCLESGAWSKTLPVCERVTCAALDHPENGSVVALGNLEAGTAVRYGCNRGFILTGNASRTCLQLNDPRKCRGEWSGVAPTCSAKECTRVKSNIFRNGTIEGSKFYYPEIILFNCRVGYRLQGGGPRWQCGQDGLWIDQESGRNNSFPTCEPSYCGPPNRPKNGSFLGNYFYFPGNISYTCDPGFCVEGSILSTCTATGTWSNQPPRCSLVVCPDLRNPQFGTVHYGSSNTEDKATYRCLPGYDLNGNASLSNEGVVCVQNQTVTHCFGTWSGSTPTCKPKTCPGPQQGVKETTYDLPFVYPNIVNVTCTEGYEVRGGNNTLWKCTENGTWYNVKRDELGEIPSCTPKECGCPNISPNCGIIGNKSQYPETVRFTRNRGYCMRGVAEIACTSNGIWSDESPKCRPIKCPKLSIPPHGRVNRSAVQNKGRRVDAWAEFSCNSGYDLNGNRSMSTYTIRCTQPDEEKDCAGSWSAKRPCCIPRSCADPNTSDFKNGSIIGKAYFYPETIRLNCAVGHELTGGTPLFQCNYEGEWEEIEESRLEVQKVVHQRIADERRRAKKCLGSKDILTLPQVTHIRSFPTCEPKNCGRPKVHENCTAKGKYFQYPGEVDIGRKRGYCLSGSRKLNCNASGVWSNDSPVCKRIECPILETPSHGIIVFKSTEKHVDDIANYTCDPGYDLNMDRNTRSFTIQCLQPVDIHQCLGSWSERPPCCIPRSCPDPHLFNIGNGTIKGSAYFYPEIIRLECDTGHELVGGGPLFQCNENGEWVPIDTETEENWQDTQRRIEKEFDNVEECLNRREIVTKNSDHRVPNFPTCKPKNCYKPFVNDHCTIVGKKYKYRDVVHFERKAGFCVEGASSVRCNSSGMWSLASPTCKRIQCPILAHPRNGMVKLIIKRRYVGDQAEYSCKKGYYLNTRGDKLKDTRQCTQENNKHQCDGAWTSSKPCCLPRACPNPLKSNFDNGTIEGDAYFFPERISLICKTGHNLTRGGPVYQCNETGSWVHLSNPSPENDNLVLSRETAERAQIDDCPVDHPVAETPALSTFPTCEPVNCKRPAGPQKGNLFGEYYQYPGNVTFSCDDGFCLQGANWITCNASGQWSDPSPSCKRVVCPELANGTNMYVEVSEDRFVGSVARYFPNLGYYLEGPINTTCLQTEDVRNCEGFWFHPPPTAKPKDCETPPRIKNGNYLLLQNRTTYRAQVQYSCSYGYKMKDGDSKRKCLHTRQWSGLHPRCQQICVDVSANCSVAQSCNVNRDGKGECSCLGKSACPSTLFPVCATDTKTYNNQCLMKIAGCEINGRDDGTEFVRAGQCYFGGICFDSKPQPPPEETCRPYLYRYYYNNESEKCEQYVHGSCYKGNNIFYTEKDCINTCVKNNPCFLDMDPGLCAVPQQRFFYNATEENCTEFMYHGCYGNENNFRSKSTCEMKCTGARLTPSPVIEPRTNTTEECCPNTIRNRCNADLVLNIDHNKKELGGRRIKLAVRFAPRSLEGNRPQEYKEVRWLSLPRVASKVDGCSVKCPRFSADGKYLVLTRNIQKNTKSRISAEKYYIISYESGRKDYLLEELKKCKDNSK